MLFPDQAGSGLTGGLVEVERPAANRLLLEVAVPIEDLARQDGQERGGGVVDERGVRGLEFDDGRVIVRRFDALEALQHPASVRGWRDALARELTGARNVLEAEFDVLRGHLTPVDRWYVVEFDSLADIEREGRSVRGHGPVLGVVRLEDQIGVLDIWPRFEPHEMPVRVGRVVLDAAEILGGVEFVDVERHVERQPSAVLGLRGGQPAPGVVAAAAPAVPPTAAVPDPLAGAFAVQAASSPKAVLAPSRRSAVLRVIAVGERSSISAAIEYPTLCAT